MWYKKELPNDLGKRDLEKLKAYVGDSYSDMNLVGQYENAIDILVNHTIEKKDRVDLIAHPLLYLMRHTIELALKENIKYLNTYSKLGTGKLKTHSIHDLFIEFDKHYNKIASDLGFKAELEDEYNRYTDDLKELIQNLGADQVSFRYVESANGSKVFNNTEILDTYDLKEKFDSSMKLLTHTADVISPYTDYVDYLKFDKDKYIKENSFGYVQWCFASFQKEWLIETLNERYEVFKSNTIWIDKDKDCYLCLKIANKKCYVIPIKK